MLPLVLARRGQHGRMRMPLIEVHLVEKVFSPEQKRQIIQKLTDAMVSIEGENMRGVTWVKISEVTSGEWGIGGKPLTTEAVKELAAGRRACCRAIGLASLAGIGPHSDAGSASARGRGEATCTGRSRGRRW